MAAHTWDGLLYIGDFLDCVSVSGHDEFNLKDREGRRLKDEFDIANEILDRHQWLIWENNPYAQFVFLEGNHEERVARYINKNPELAGLIDVPICLRLKERGFQWVEAWTKSEDFKIGKATFTHGRKTGQYHAKQMVTDYGRSIFYGHTHDMMCIPIAHKGKDEIMVGQSIGCLCEYELPYMKGRASRWQQGFMVLYVLPDGRFTYYTPRIFEHEFVGPDGVLYTPETDNVRV